MISLDSMIVTLVNGSVW